MKKMVKIVLEIEVESDNVSENDPAVRECVYSYLQELIDDDSLDYEVES